MTTKIITTVDQAAASRVPVISAYTPPPAGTLADTRGRLLRDLRISVTDRCNFRCTYCMPKAVFGKDYSFFAKIRTFELRGNYARDSPVRRTRCRENSPHRRRTPAA